MTLCKIEYELVCCISQTEPEAVPCVCLALCSRQVSVPLAEVIPLRTSAGFLENLTSSAAGADRLVKAALCASWDSSDDPKGLTQAKTLSQWCSSLNSVNYENMYVDTSSVIHALRKIDENYHLDPFLCPPLSQLLLPTRAHNMIADSWVSDSTPMHWYSAD